MFFSPAVLLFFSNLRLLTRPLFFFSPFRQIFLSKCNLLSWLCSTRKRAYELFWDRDAVSFDFLILNVARQKATLEYNALFGQVGCSHAAEVREGVTTSEFLVFRWSQENKNFLLSFDACTLFLSTFFFVFSSSSFLPQSDRCLLAS